MLKIMIFECFLHPNTGQEDSQFYEYDISEFEKYEKKYQEAKKRERENNGFSSASIKIMWKEE